MTSNPTVDEFKQQQADARAEADRRKQAQEKRDHERIEAERAAIRADLPAALAGRGVPAILQTARLDNAPDLPAPLVEAVAVWAADPRGFLTLSGEPGGGKSYLAAAALAEIFNARTFWPNAAMWLEQAAWLRSVKINYGQIEVSPRAARTPLLVFDDFGMGYLNELRRAALEELIRARYDKQRPTIITTNLPLDEITARLGARVSSVIVAGRRFFEFPRPDLRIAGTIKPPEPARWPAAGPT